MRLSHTNCHNCSIKDICLPVVLLDSELELLENIIQRRKNVAKNSNLFQQGDDFDCLFAVRSGSFKTYNIQEDGDTQITGFHLPGEIIGLDGISAQHYRNVAEATSSSSVCIIPYQQLESLCLQLPELQHQLLKILSQEIQFEQELITLLNKKNSTEKVAAFLINLGVRYARRGLSREHFSLEMSRSDMANYLGLASETTSRALSKFKEDGLISYQGKDMEILDFKSLASLAGSHC